MNRLIDMKKFPTDESGISMVEVLVSLVILLVVSMGLMGTALVSIEQNTKNQLRDEAVRIAEQKMDEQRQLPIASLVNGTIQNTITAPIRNMEFKYIVNTTVTPQVDATQINVDVFWKWKNMDVPPHSISTLRGSN